MKKKFGISIAVGIIVFAVIISILGIAYTGIDNVYSASKSDISKVEFAKSELKIEVGEEQGICPIITLNDGTKYDPSKNYSEVIADKNYQYYVSQLELTGSTGVISTKRKNDRFVVTGKKDGSTSIGLKVSGKTIKAPQNIKIIVGDGDSQSTKNESNNNNPSKSDIEDVKFASSQLVIDLDTMDSRQGICPIITLNDGTKYDPSKNYNEVIADENYQYYVSQLELTSWKADSKNGFDKTTDILKITEREKDRFIITAKKTGKCIIGVKVKGDSKDDDTMTVIIKDKNNPNPGQIEEEEEIEDIELELGQEDTKWVPLKNNKSVKVYLSYITNLSKTQQKSIKWESSDTSIATVDGKGYVTCKKPGKVEITISYGNISDSCYLDIYSEDLEIFNSSNDENITDKLLQLDVDEKLKVYIKQNGQKLSSDELEFTSSNEKFCKVDEDGNIEAIVDSRGYVRIEGRLKKDIKCKATVKINVVDKEAQALKKGTFSFVIDPKTNAPKKYVGANGFVKGESYTVNFIKPEGFEDAPVELSVTSGGKNVTEQYIKYWTEEDNGAIVTKLTALESTNGKSLNFIATIKSGKNEKSTSGGKIQIFNTMQEKEEKGGSETPYIEISYPSDIRMVQVGNSMTLKPIIDTNISIQGYEMKYTSSDESVATISSKGNLKALKEGTTVIKAVATNKNMSTVNSTATITIEVKDKVTLVKSISLSEKAVSNLTKKNSRYQLEKGKGYNFEFEVSPSDATIKEYSLDIDDKENFLIEGNTVIALAEDKDATITATSLDSSGKKTTVKVHSIISEEEKSKIESIENVDEINILVGETVIYKYDEGTNYSYSLKNTSSIKKEDGVLKITGKKVGSGVITLNINGKSKKVNVNVSLTDKPNEGDVLVEKIAFPIDPETNITKDYVNNYPLQVGNTYSFGLTILPENATNKDVVYSVNNSNFTVTEEGIRANKPNITATLTVTSASNPKVSASIKIGSIDNKIASIKFAKNYTGDKKFDITKHEEYECNLIITLIDNYVYDPTTQDLSKNSSYKSLLKQIKLVSDNENILKTNKLTVSPVKGVNGSGTLTAQVIYDNSISATTTYESVGINSNLSIKKVEFSRSSYDIEKYGKLGFCPIITLSDNTVLKPSDKNSVSKTAEYQYYLSKLELKKIESDDSTGILSTGRLLKNLSRESDRLTVEAAEWIGKCKLGIDLDGNTVAETIVNVIEPKTSDEGIKVDIVEIDHAITTTDKSLDIVNIKFAKNSYTLDGNYGYIMNPIITLSDGTELNSENLDKGLDKQIYYYYCGLTDIYLTNTGSSSTIDFGVIEVQNRNTIDEQPKYIVPLKNGNVELAIGLKSNGRTFDTTKITVDM